MTQIVYLPDQYNPWTPFRCPHSQLTEFDPEEADRKCFMLIDQGHAIAAKVIDETGELSVWVLDEARDRPVKVKGHPG